MIIYVVNLARQVLKVCQLQLSILLGSSAFTKVFLAVAP